MIQRIERDEGSRFQVYIQVTKPNGKRGKKYVGTYDSKRDATEAEQDAESTQRKIERGELPAELDDKRTVGAGIDEWLTALEKRGARAHTAYSWFVTLIKPTFGGTAIARVTKPAIVRWRDELTQRYSPATVNSALGCLSSAFAEFIDRQWIPANPCHGVKGVKVKDADAYLWIRTKPEIERLLASAEGDFRDLLAVAIGTGMRLDEVLHLHHDDVDLAGRLITVQRGRKGPPKSGKVRHVPILDSVLPVLQARALRRGGNVLVFPNRNGKVRDKCHVGVTYKAALKRAELDTRLRFHDLRHTFASHWVMSGGDIFRLARVLGHSKVEITAKTYAHLAPEVWRQDYHRVSFDLPGEDAKVIRLVAAG